jgi:hypothetical protein
VAARNWTIEQRARQASLIRGWKPWEKSTGAITIEGKRKSSRNAFRYTLRKGVIFQSWLLKQANHIRSGKLLFSIEEGVLRAKKCGLTSF